MDETARKKAKKRKNRVIGFQVLEDECIWMKAGVVNFRLCDNDYDCYNCPFDQGMRKALNLESSEKRGKEKPGWVQHLQKKYHGASRPCRHALTGRIDAPKICTMNYECYHCPYDQMLDELDIVRPVDAPSYKLVSGYKIAEGYYYHMGHSWARFEHGGRVRVGFDDFLVKLFGAAHTLKLPPLGSTLSQSQVGWTFNRDNHAAAVLAPVTGTVLATNHRVLERPEITIEDPYQTGWLFILEPKLPKRDLKGLYYAEDGVRWMEKESQKLMSIIGPEYEEMVPTGGEAVHDLYGTWLGSLMDIKWENLVRTFLRTEIA